MTGIADGLRAALFDLDGTVYHGGAAVPGAVAFLERLNHAGIACRFVTNRANRRPEEVEEHLRRLGIPAGPRDVITSAEAAARLCAGRRVSMIGTEALAAALETAGATLTEDAPQDMVVGYDPAADLAAITRASRHILAGARFVATNPDPWITSEAGVVPENGAILAAITAVTGAVPLVAGKPARAVMDLALERIGAPPEAAIMIGDNPATDVAAGKAAGMRTVLILTGVTDAETARAAAMQATWTVPDYGTLDRILFGPA